MRTTSNQPPIAKSVCPICEGWTAIELTTSIDKNSNEDDHKCDGSPGLRGYETKLRLKTEVTVSAAWKSSKGKRKNTHPSLNAVPNDDCSRAN